MTNLQKQNSSGWKLIDPNQGTFLGRTAGSWARILFFYTIYYSLLTALILVTVDKWSSNLPQPGSDEKNYALPRINTRLDQPGVAAYPMTAIPAYVDKDPLLKLTDEVSFTKENVMEKDYDWKKELHEVEHGSFWYVKTMLDFANSYPKKGIDCKNDVKKHNCAVENASKITFDTLVKSLNDKKPMVALAINKKIGWKPITKNANFLGPNKTDEDHDGKKYRNSNFVANSVFAHCFDINTKENDGKVSSDPSFVIKPVEGSPDNIGPEFFPYDGRDEKRQDGGLFSRGKKTVEATSKKFSNPFILVQVEPVKTEEGGDPWVPKPNDKKKIEGFKFACYFKADNVEHPAYVEQYENDKKMRHWSEEMKKMNVGYLDFTFSFTPNHSIKGSENANGRSASSSSSDKKGQGRASSTSSDNRGKGRASSPESDPEVNGSEKEDTDGEE